MYQQTKGIRGYLLNNIGSWVLHNFSEMIKIIVEMLDKYCSNPNRLFPRE